MCRMKTSWAFSQNYNVLHVSLFSQLPCFMYLTSSFPPPPTVPTPPASWKCGVSSVSCQRSTCYNTLAVCVCVWEVGQQWLGTDGASKRIVLAACEPTAVWTRPNSSFVTVKQTLSGWIFIHQTFRALFKRFTDSLETLFVVIPQWCQFSFFFLFIIK